MVDQTGRLNSPQDAMPIALNMPLPFRGSSTLLPMLADCVGEIIGHFMHMEVWPWAGQGMTLRGDCSVWMQGRRGNASGQGSEPDAAEDSQAEPQLYHRPVLPEEVLEFLQPRPGKIFLDATLGGG